LGANTDGHDAGNDRQSMASEEPQHTSPQPVEQAEMIVELDRVARCFA
jgi:hypothetical protein